ncbi:Qb-SNARE protein, putative [Leishmania panamensis]|uniref:Qb-SNARE protein, putative n=1 Tax=Leishmania panamensis TaxID=5679 RepID=A0A088RQ46_LEIPA|nr:Qb-SNARE protein, putative [Leishmania panamensis]AIN98088.1 Qb-SNARE protein, putative [Leishmania panamensis]
MITNDPFNDSVKELRELVVRAKLIEQQVTQKGVISPSSATELRDTKESAEELLQFLKEMLRVVDERGGRVQGKVFSANEIMERQTIVRSLESDVAEARIFYEKIVASAAQRQRVAEASVAGPGEIYGGAPDEFISAQTFAQREEEKVQDEVLDRLTLGLRELRETGFHIHEELDTQEIMLDNVDRDISSVQVRLRAANAKVDKLLASMSNKGKVGVIAMLLFILVLLAFFGLR